LEAVHDTGKVCIIECDVQGAQKLKKQQGTMSFVYIFIKAPSMEALEERIRKRNMDTDDRIKIRLETARAELKFIEENDMFYDKVMTNDNLDNAYMQLKKTLKLFGGLV
jgi:guanylate kinase